MTNELLEPEDYDDDLDVESAEEIAAVTEALVSRCKSAGITFELGSDQASWLGRVGMKCGRHERSITVWSAVQASRILSVPFEKYVYLSNLEAICSYKDGTIEAGIVSADGYGILSGFRALFGKNKGDLDAEESKLMASPREDVLPHIEISPPTQAFRALRGQRSRGHLTLKLSNCRVQTHDSAVALVHKIAGSVFFQVDLMKGVPLTVERARPRTPRRVRPSVSRLELQYPQTQFESAPLSLYSYGRSANGMPLLQFLAFYQVIEFFFPIYSQSEAQRKLKAILKDPSFRGDRDSDVAKLLASIHVSRGGAFGDERSQLSATLLECTDSDSLRSFLLAEPGRKAFFESKAQSPYYKLPLANPSNDLRNDVAQRIYDIRCRIVHTKVDSRDGSVELLLPFSTEAEQLAYDIELAQYLAQRVLIASSTPLNIHD